MQRHIRCIKRRFPEYGSHWIQVELPPGANQWPILIVLSTLTLDNAAQLPNQDNTVQKVP